MATARWLAIVVSLALLIGQQPDALALDGSAGPPVVGAPGKLKATKPGRCRGKGKRRRACRKAAIEVGVGITPPDVPVVQCDPPEADLPTLCRSDDVHVDEISTWLFNTVLQRGCGRFIIHHRSGNAELGRRESCPGLDALPTRGSGSIHCPVGPQVPDLEHVLDRRPDFGGTFDFPEEHFPHGIDRPDLSRDLPDEPAWVLALRGCGLGAVTRVTVSGDGVDAYVVHDNEIAGWRVPLSPSSANDAAGIRPRVDFDLELRGTAQSTAFVRFEASASATPVDARHITVHFADGSSQELEHLRLVVARNGVVEALEPAAARWEDRPALTMTGEHLGNAALLPRPCVRSPEVVLNPEDRLIVRATLACPREVVDPWQPEHVSTVNDPSCTCMLSAYDDLLSIYHELPKQPFAYGESIDVGPNLEYLAQNPALLGDSLSQGFYGGAVKPQTQLWAHPQVVAFLMGAGVMEQNLIRTGPGVEDAVKTLLPVQFGLPPDFMTELAQGENVGLAVGSNLVTTRPHHTGIAGLDYTNILRTTGRCLDIEATAESPLVLREPPDGDSSLRYDNRIESICNGVDCCQPDPGCHAERPWLEVQLGLGCSNETPMEMIQAHQPTFIFASAAQNHFLGCATHTKVDDCVELDRFYRDSQEVFRRLRRVDSIRGGIVFGVPPLSQIPFLVQHAAGGRRVFWKRDGEVDTAAEVLDANELARLTARIDEANAHLEHLASLNGYAFVRSTEVFNRLSAVGVPIVDQNSGEQLCRVRPVIPTETLDRDFLPGDDAGCGMFGLDAVHPGKLGHAIMANEMIRSINDFYGVDIPILSAADLFAVWQVDSLNQDPVDIRAFLSGPPPTACLEALAEFSATLSTAPACAMTLGALCPYTLVTAIAAAGDAVECSEALVREAIRASFNTIDREPEPKICWGGPDAGVCHFAP